MRLFPALALVLAFSLGLLLSGCGQQYSGVRDVNATVTPNAPAAGSNSTGMTIGAAGDTNDRTANASDGTTLTPSSTECRLSSANDPCREPCVECPPCPECSALVCMTPSECEALGFNVSDWRAIMRAVQNSTLTAVPQEIVITEANLTANSTPVALNLTIGEPVTLPNAVLTIISLNATAACEEYWTGCHCNPANRHYRSRVDNPRATLRYNGETFILAPGESRTRDRVTFTLASVTADANCPDDPGTASSAVVTIALAG